MGHYEWECATDRDSLSTDDALTLSLRLRGDGDPKRTAPPVLTLPAGLEAFEPKVLEEEEYEKARDGRGASERRDSMTGRRNGCDDECREEEC